MEMSIIANKKENIFLRIALNGYFFLVLHDQPCNIIKSLKEIRVTNIIRSYLHFYLESCFVKILKKETATLDQEEPFALKNFRILFEKLNY